MPTPRRWLRRWKHALKKRILWFSQMFCGSVIWTDVNIAWNFGCGSVSYILVHPLLLKNIFAIHIKCFGASCWNGQIFWLSKNLLEILRKAAPVFFVQAHPTWLDEIQWVFLISTAVPNRVLTDFFFVISTGVTGFCGSFSSNWIFFHHVFHDFGDVGWILAFLCFSEETKGLEEG